MNRLHTTDVLQRVFQDLKFLDYGANFNQLWQMAPLGTDHAIVVWADTPVDPMVSPIDTEPNLTPFDWAIAACIRQGNLRVTVIDLRHRLDDVEKYAALRWLSTQRPECVPWLRRLGVEELVRGTEDAEAPTLKDIHARLDRPWGKNGNAKLKVQPADVLRTLPICRIDPSRDATHHAIANLVGPLLLIRNPLVHVGAGSTSHREAIRQVLDAAKLVPSSDTRGSNERSQAPRTEIHDALAELGVVRFVLLDDQWHHGWAEWVCECLRLPWRPTAVGGLGQSRTQPQCVAGSPNKGVSLWVSTSPHWALECAKKALEGKDKDARFELRLTSGEGEFAEILLLDLRLFAGGGDEEGFVREATKLARRFMSAGWAPGFSDDDLRWVESGSWRGDGVDDARVLTLLPRLLAHTDFSLPIVLFSSSRRRDVVKDFKDYPSIFAQFSKPLLFGSPPSDLVERSEEALQSALKSAAKLLKGRQLCQRVMRAAGQYQVLDRRAASRFRHFEIYLDESGSSARDTDPNAAEPEKNRFVVAGLVVGYLSAVGDGSPIVCGNRMQEHGLQWWPKDIGDSYLLKRDSHEKDCDDRVPGAVAKPADEIVGEFLRCFDSMPVYGVCLEDRDRTNVGEGDVARALWRDDNRHRENLSVLLELILFDLLPEVIAYPDATISIFVATRVRKAKEFGDKGPTITRLKTLFGYGGGESYMQTLAASSVLPIVLRALDRRGGSLSVGRLEHARGATLAYPELAAVMPADGRAPPEESAKSSLKTNKPRGDFPRNQHYIADLVANVCYKTGGNFLPNSSSLFQNGIYDLFDMRLCALLRAGRAQVTGDYATALLELANCDLRQPLKRRSAAALLVHRLAKMISEDLSTSDVVSFMRRVDSLESSALGEGVSHVERGTIVRYFEEVQRGFIRVDQAPDDNTVFYLDAWESATYPSQDERVELKRRQRGDGRWKATWVRALA